MPVWRDAISSVPLNACLVHRAVSSFPLYTYLASRSQWRSPFSSPGLILTGRDSPLPFCTAPWWGTFLPSGIRNHCFDISPSGSLMNANAISSQFVRSSRIIRIQQRRAEMIGYIRIAIGPNRRFFRLFRRRSIGFSRFGRGRNIFFLVRMCAN